jgi:FtsH-binding integral membrane protein
MAKGFFESLFDFSFREWVTPRSLALIYGLHLLAGLIAAVVLVANGFRDSTSQGLLMLVISIVGFFFWTLYVRIALETLQAIFRIADAASPQDRH